MAGYLLDTNHLGAAVQRVSRVRDQLQQRQRQGERFGTCVPVLCELEAGFHQLARPAAHRQRLQRLLQVVKVWPLDQSLAIIYGETYQELTRKGRILSFVDLILACMAKQQDLTVLTADLDFSAVRAVRTENWLN